MDLFPGLFQDGTFLIPTGSLTEEVTIDLVFSKDGALDTNERAVFMPSLSTKTRDSLAQVAVKEVGNTTNAGDNRTNVVLTEAGKGSRMLVDIVAGLTTNVRVLDGGRGFSADEEIAYDTAPASLNPTSKVKAGNIAFNKPTSSDNIKVIQMNVRFLCRRYQPKQGIH